jgi:ribosomal protein S18 acetylase RimI-like enzyme
MAARDDRKIFALIKEQLLPYTKKSFPSLKFKKDEVRQRLKNGTTLVISRRKSPPLGFVHFRRNADDASLFIDMIAINGKYQSKGWGKQLLLKAEETGKQKGCRTAYLYVDEVNSRAQKFYYNHGYGFVNYAPDIKCYLLSKELQ